SRKNFMAVPVAWAMTASPYPTHEARSRPMNTDSPEAVKAPRTVPVLVPAPAPGPYSYKVPEGMDLRPGDIVAVPLGPRLVHGLVADGDPGRIDASRLREVRHRFDCPPLEPGLLRFIHW